MEPKLKLVMGWFVGNGVGEPAAPFTQFKFVVYCNKLLTLPVAIFSLTVMPTPDDKVATAAPNGPRPAPDEVAVERAEPLLVACAP